MKDIIDLKNKIWLECFNDVEEKIDITQKEINDIQNIANNETKSSAGDKYETSREMLQQEKDKLEQQLSLAIFQKNILSQIDPKIIQENITNGSLAITSIGNFYFSISKGKIKVEQKIYYCISLEAPIGQKLYGQSKNDEIIFQGKKIKIIEVF